MQTNNLYSAKINKFITTHFRPEARTGPTTSKQARWSCTIHTTLHMHHTAHTNTEKSSAKNN